MKLNPWKKSEIYDVENEDDYDDQRKKLEREESKFIKGQKIADDLRLQADDATQRQELRKSDLEELRRRHEEEEVARKAKKASESRNQVAPPIPPVTTIKEDIAVVEPENSLLPETEKSNVRVSVPLVMNPTIEKSIDNPESTENVSAPIIGSSPSIFYRTPWFQTDRPLHGLSMNGYAGDVHCDAGTFGKIASIGATLRGQKHQVSDKGTGAAGQNEDWFSTFCGVSALGKKYVATVVCDGLSSAHYSWYGARRTSTSLARDIALGIGDLSEVNASTIQPVVDCSLAEQAATLMSWNTREYGAPQADPSTIDPMSLGCTVTVLVVSAEPDGNGTHHVVAGNVGDSPIFNLSEGQWRKVSPLDIDSGEILDTKTHAFPRHTECALIDDVLKQGECVLVTSDGVGNFILRNGKTLALGNFLSTRWNKPLGIMSFLNQLSFDLPTADDDRTAVAFWPG
jgi:hypothetical protein